MRYATKLRPWPAQWIDGNSTERHRQPLTWTARAPAASPHILRLRTRVHCSADHRRLFTVDAALAGRVGGTADTQRPDRRALASNPLDTTGRRDRAARLCTHR